MAQISQADIFLKTLAEMLEIDRNGTEDDDTRRPCYEEPSR